MTNFPEDFLTYLKKLQEKGLCSEDELSILDGAGKPQPDPKRTTHFKEVLQ